MFPFSETCRMVQGRRGYSWSCRSELKVALDGKSRYRFNECIG